MRETTEIFMDAVKDGVMKPIVPRVVDESLRHVTTEKTISDNELTNVAMDGRAAQRLEHHFCVECPLPVDPPTNWTAGRFYELARITIPYGVLGVMQRCEVDWINTTTGNTNWQDNTTAPAADGEKFSFHVRYQHISQEMGGRILGAAPVKWIPGLPGMPYFWSRSWSRGWYQISNINNNVNWNLMPGFHYRMFAFCEVNTAVRYGFGGRFTASVQSEKSLSALYQSRRNYS